MLSKARDWYERFCISPATTLADAVEAAPVAFHVMFLALGVMGALMIFLALGVK